jgi:hypothetical protein
MNVVCHLGGFHVIMSFLGSIGTIMAGSELSDTLQTCYRSVTIDHMMSGKAKAKAVGRRMLVEAALTVLLLRTTVDEKSCISTQDVDHLFEVDRSVSGNSFSLSDDNVLLSSVEKLQKSLVDLKTKLNEIE